MLLRIALDSEAIAPPSAETAATGHAQGDVLVVEDDPGAVRLVRAYLDAEGIPMRVAGDAETALVEARRKLPAAIVLDVLLPGIDGWDLLRTLKADDQLPDAPGIIAAVIDERGDAIGV